MKIDATIKIKESISMFDVCDKYGYDFNKKGFMNCPFHSEKTPSMRIYEKDFHCFGCQEHGDIISFVQKLFNLSFPETLKKIDADFRLNIYGEHSFKYLKSSYYKQQIAKAKRDRLKFQKERADKEYWGAFDEWKRLDDNKRLYRPKSPDEELHPLFIESLQNLSHQEYKLDCLEEKRRNYA